MTGPGLVDVWLTPKQWDIVRSALIHRGRKVDRALDDLMWSKLYDHPVYRRYLQPESEFDGQ